jgi:transposase
MIDQLDAELDGFDTALAHIARTQPGCNARMRRYEIGWLTAVAIWAQFGDACRFAGARQAVRFTGLDITISEPDGKPRGHLARQGSPVLRWVLRQAAMRAARPGSPDHAYYLRSSSGWVASGPRCRCPQARPRGLHTLRDLGDQGMLPSPASHESTAVVRPAP